MIWPLVGHDQTMPSCEAVARLLATTAGPLGPGLAEAVDAGGTAAAFAGLAGAGAGAGLVPWAGLTEVTGAKGVTAKLCAALPLGNGSAADAAEADGLAAAPSGATTRKT